MGDVFVEGGKKTEKERRRENERERKERNRRKENRERGRRKGEREGEKEIGLSLARRRSNGRDSSDQEVKSVYAMRAMLQEVGILRTLVYFPP